LTLDPQIDAEQLQLQNLQCVITNVQKIFDASRREGFSDGACVHMAFEFYRRAGCGVYFGEGHADNVCVLLTGVIQTNQRSELSAILFAVMVSSCPLWIKTDSEWCIGIWSTIVCNDAVPNFGIEHVDLWLLLWEYTHIFPVASDGGALAHFIQRTSLTTSSANMIVTETLELTNLQLSPLLSITCRYIV
jgi:hypothetical protein